MGPVIAGAFHAADKGMGFGPAGQGADRLWKQWLQAEFIDQPAITESWAKKLISNDMLVRFSAVNGFDFSKTKFNNLTIAERGIGGVTLAPWLAGNYATARENVLLSAQFNPDFEMLFELYRRRLITKELFTFWMQQLGVREDLIIDAVADLRLIIPEVDELIRFGTRHAFDPDIIKKYEFANEIPPTILQWVNKKGLSMEVGFNKPPSVRADGKVDPERPATWFDLYWFAHWVYPSLTEGYTMLQRLYPDSPHGKSPLVKGGQSWDEKDMNLLLRAQDIPTYFRERLMTIAYNPLSRVDIRRMYKLKVLTKDEVYHSYRQIGYNNEDAERLVKFTVAQAEGADADAKYALAKSKVCKYYGLGILTREQASDSLEQAGLTRNQADIFIAACDIDIHADHVARQIKLLKESFMLGVFDVIGIRAPLVQTGIRPDMVDLYIQEWNMERSIKRKEPTAALFIDWLVNGQISETEVTGRMQNLNYDSIYITNTLVTARRKRSDLLGKELQKSVKEQQQAIKTAKAEAKATSKAKQAEQDKSFKAAIAGETEKNITAWLSGGLIRPDQAGDMLRDKGWMESDVQLWLKNAQSSGGASGSASTTGGTKNAAKKKAKKSSGTTPTQPTGG
jgi:hypothetical protein